MTNEEIITKEFQRVSACLNAICIFLSEEVLTDSQSKKLGDVMRIAANNLTAEEQEKKNNKHIKEMGEFFKKMEANEKHQEQ